MKLKPKKAIGTFEISKFDILLSFTWCVTIEAKPETAIDKKILLLRYQNSKVSSNA